MSRSLSERLFSELVLTALAAERRLRPYVGEIGADPTLFRGFGRFGRWQEIPHPSRFVRERSEDGDRVGELYTRMIETDANMAALWEKRVKAVLALPRYIRAADSTPIAEEIARFVQTALSLIPLRVVPISNILEAIIKGVAINEILWERATRGPLAGAWLPVDIIDRPMWRFGWSAVDRSLHVVAHPGHIDPIPAPPMKFQVLSYGTRDNPWGRALLDRLYWVWYLKRHASKFWALFVERFAQPLTKGTYPFKADQDVLNKENEDRLLAILNSIRTGSSIALPEGLDITFLEASRGGDASYSSFVSWLERAEGLLMLGEVDTSGLAKGAGSFAKALISNEVRLETVQHDAHLLGSFESDTLVRWLVLLNFGPDAPVPKSVYDDSDAADRNQRMQGITKALNDGVAVPVGYYRMTMRVPAPFDNEPVVEREPAVEAVSPPSPSSLSSLVSFSSLSAVPSPGALVEARDSQLQTVAAHFAPALTSYFASQLERLLALLDEETTAGPLDRLVASNTPTAVVDAIQTAQIHGGGLALLHAREDLGALRLASEADRAAVGGARTERNCLSPKGEFEHRPQPAHTPRPSLSPDGWSGALTPTSAIDFWAAHLGHAKDFLLNLSGAARRIAAACAALAEGPLLINLHEVLERAKAAGLDRATVPSRLRQTYETHGLLPSSSHHADLVIATNIQQAAHTVRYTQLVDNPAAIRQVPYLVWWTVGDDRVRHRLLHNHVVMHARVFAIDHPIWKTWWPPAGFNCRCGIGTISVEEAQRLGLVGSEPTGPWPTAPGTGGPALPDPGFQGAPALATVAEHLTAQTRRIYLDAQAQGGDLLAAITRLFTTLNLLEEVRDPKERP